MAQSMKPAVGTPIPDMSFALLGGGTATLGGGQDHYTMFMIYRGKHCPRCKKYLNQLEAMLPQFAQAGIEVLVVSADPEVKAAADQAEFGWSFPLGYDLSEAQMRALGLYVTDPLSPEETDRRFAEPAIFGIKPNGEVQLVCLSNGPAARPDLAELLDGMMFNIKNDRPTRGLA